jgi:hypothetical protein
MQANPGSEKAFFQGFSFASLLTSIVWKPYNQPGSTNSGGHEEVSHV